MKQLTLIRHAKSSWDPPGLADFERPLNQRGETDAPKMGQWLKEQNHHFDIMVTSPAIRAQTTANMIANEIGLPSALCFTNDSIYEASTGDLQGVVNAVNDEIGSLCLVGHNPGMSTFASLLANQAIEMPTCAIVYLSLDIDSWSECQAGCGQLGFFTSPKKI